MDASNNRSRDHLGKFKHKFFIGSGAEICDHASVLNGCLHVICITLLQKQTYEGKKLEAGTFFKF